VSIRNLLLPGLWAEMHSDGRGNYDLVDEGGNIRVKDSDSGKSSVILTRDEIEDGSFRTLYGPRLKALKKGIWP
jgi:hypothetical protein